jgi:hypothetical protein
MNNFTCKSCRGTFDKLDPGHGADGFCAICSIIFGITKLHDSHEKNMVEIRRTLEGSRKLQQILDLMSRPSISTPTGSEGLTREHKGCPWCGSAGFVVQRLFYEEKEPRVWTVAKTARCRIACSATECAAAPELSWSNTPEEAWKLWDTRVNV